MNHHHSQNQLQQTQYQLQQTQYQCNRPSSTSSSTAKNSVV